jgi:hypothetical protein
MVFMRYSLRSLTSANLVYFVQSKIQGWSLYLYRLLAEVTVQWNMQNTVTKYATLSHHMSLWTVWPRIPWRGRSWDPLSVSG